MRKPFAVLALALAAASAQAQEARRPVGIGISIVPLESAGATPTVQVYVPVNLAPTLRIEPSVGIRTHDEPTPGTDTRDVTVGVGVFYVQRVAAPFDVYMGGRLGLNFARVERTNAQGATTSDSGTDVVIAAALGGEQFLSPHFSLGAEAQLGYRSNSSASGDDSSVFTTGLAFVRFYF